MMDDATRRARRKARAAAAVSAPETDETPRSGPSVLDLCLQDAVRDSYETFRDHMPGAMLFPRKAALRRHALAQALSGPLAATGFYAEFGVWRGQGVNLFARDLAPHGLRIAGFDSFEGLEEDWTGQHKGRERGGYSTDGVLPEVEGNVDLVKGWVQDTLPGWLSARPGQAVAFAHLDMDTYTPTAFALAALQDRIVPGTVLVFDELYGYPGWRQHEWRALTETVGTDGLRWLSFSDQAAAALVI
jgi:Methyltransferase domain